jgi:tetratricopeptide (TPR) repeat protein
MKRPVFGVVGLVVGALVGVAGVPGAAAQAPADRQAIGRFRDSLEVATDESGLRQLEARLMLAAKRDRKNASRHLSLGWLALRLREYPDATSEFKWAAQLEPQWPLAWLGLGLAELGQGQLADTTRLGRQALLSQDAWARASQAFGRAVGSEPTLVSQLEGIAEESIKDSSVGRARVVRDGLRRAAAAGKPRSSIVTLALGRVERALGDTTAALAAFASAAELPGGKGPGLFEQARTRLQRGDRGGIQLYFDAIATNDSVTAAAVRGDLVWIATPQELASFDQSSGAERARLVWEFWTGRDRRELRPNGDRLAEHYRRIGAIPSLYPNPADQRAKVFVRHGEPDGKVAAEFAGVGANESWWYRRPDGELVAHFASQRDGRRYDLVESVFDIAVEPDRSSPAGDEEGPNRVERTETLLRSRAQLSPFYQAGAASRREQLATFRAKERALGRESLRELLTTDRFPLKFGRELAARHRLVAIGSAGGGPMLDLFFSLPALATPPVDSGAQSFYPVRVRLVVWDSLDRPARALDSTMSIPAESKAVGGAVAGHLDLALPAGRYAARFAIETSDGSGFIAHREGIRLGPVSGEPSLTDLMVATGRSGIPVPGLDSSGGDRVDPTAFFARSDTLIAAAGVLGAAAGPAKLRALLRPIPNPADPNPKWRSFPGQDDWVPGSLSGADYSIVRLVLPLKRVKAGGYEIEVVLVDARGRTSRNRAVFAVE